MKLLGRTASGNEMRNARFLILTLTLAALALRVTGLESVPPGWRDDELINSLVISQKALDGEVAVYYADASGHEALYHLLNAAMLALFGPGVPGIRWLSAILGTLTVPLTYLVGNRLFGRAVGLLSAAALTLSFWSLMYSRIGIRHISLPVFMLAAFYFFLRALAQYEGRVEAGTPGRPPQAQILKRPLGHFLLAGLFLGIGFYTYFASRGAPLILLIFCAYLWLFQRPLLRRAWAGILLMFGLAALLAVPLAFVLLGQPESESRVSELAAPLAAARTGDLRPLGENIAGTLSMFHSSGDEEWLYNIPGRPLFGAVGAIFFWLGVSLAAWYALRPLFRAMYRSFINETPVESLAPSPHLEAAGSFSLIWWLVGIAPAFVSVPAASLGHTIVAQPVVYVLAALPLLFITRSQLLKNQRGNRHGNGRGIGPALALLAGLLLLAAVAWRDLPDYFQRWPDRGMTRFLYRADIKSLARYVRDNPELTDFGVSGLLAGPWDRIAFEIDAGSETDARPRWHNPERAILLRTGGEPAQSFSGYPRASALGDAFYKPVPGLTVAGYELSRVAAGVDSAAEPLCFENGLCLLASDYDAGDGTLMLTWELIRPLDLPVMPLISNPPPPGVYAGPRLLVFAQLLGVDGQVLAIDDGMWVDVTTLRDGDRFLQQHRLTGSGDDSPVAVTFGLYDPMTGERLRTMDGRDHLQLETDE
jgi:4-amino-4-deoxy-L-arabinose transferase-like glycosyltransferase